MNVTILGCGYSGLAIAQQLIGHGVRNLAGTRRSATGLAELRSAGIAAYALDGAPDAALIERLGTTTHLISSVAPSREPPLHDPMLELVSGLAGAGRLPAMRWIGYLSTIGVYGNHDGGRVDEDTPCTSLQSRSIMRREAEQGWQALGTRLMAPVSVLRLSGIYGPGRNAVRDALDGRARMLIKPGQVFNRIHVNDLAAAVRLAATRRHAGILNITDDTPAAPQEVIRFAHALIDKPAPEAVDFASADISTMARSFYNENKRVDNARSKRVLDLHYDFPDYRAGLRSVLQHELCVDG